MARDEKYMKLALELAKKGLGRTSPNPVVGCVIVKGNRVVGKGWHKKAGKPHAEVEALKDAGKKANGATLYVTLEPCCHLGKTLPCTKAIIGAGIKKVVYAMQDPNKLVCGKGCKELYNAGIALEGSILEDKAKELNEVFIKHIKTKTPFVLAKAALSVDGKMAAKDGSSQWITDEKSRKADQELRNQYDAIMVGANTIINDDPLLTCRIPGGRNPVRVVVDAILRAPLDARVFNKDAKTIVATTSNSLESSRLYLERKGVRVLVLGDGERIDLERLMRALYSEGITSVLIEGGGEVIGSAFDSKIVDKIAFFIGPIVIGGKYAVSISGEGVTSIGKAIKIDKMTIEKIGDDFLLTGYPKYPR